MARDLGRYFKVAVAGDNIDSNGNCDSQSNLTSTNITENPLVLHNKIPKYPKFSMLLASLVLIFWIMYEIYKA